ncbi:MAG: LruC domain-containing protein [Bacteroidales bacterium]|nr:LruC domain-containing protein [Bacteroidales bacterium]
MKNKILILLPALVALFAMASCVKNNFDVPDPTIDNVAIPSDFAWNTISSVPLTVTPADEYNAQFYYVIEVFGENPLFNNAAPLLAKGVAKGDNSFVMNLVLPTYTKEIYVRQTDPAQHVVIQSVQVSGGALVCDFNSVSAPVLAPQARAASAMPSLRSAKVPSQNPTPSNVRILRSTSADVNWENNINYLIPEDETFTGSIALGDHSCLYIEGTYEIARKETFAIANGGKLVIQSGGKMKVPSSVNLSFHIGELINYGSLIADGTFALTSKSTMYNTGTMSFANFTSSNADNGIINDGVINAVEIQLQSNPFTNNGSFNAGVFEASTNCVFENNGSATIAELDAKSGSKIYNNCHILINTLLDLHGTTYYGYKGSLLKASLMVADGTSFQLLEGSILDVQTAQFSTWRNYIKGIGSDYALARLGSVDSYKNAVSKNITYQGKVEVECSDHLTNEKNNPFFVVEDETVRWSAAGSSTTVIESTECNDGGNGQNTGGGGEEPPTDPNFPIVVNLTTNYSFIMEDNWPWMGDYDLNDLVVDLNISYLQNAQNKAIEMTVVYKLRAVGAEKTIAGAFQLDKISAGQISSVSHKDHPLTGAAFATEGGLETGQSKAVIPLFDNAHSLLNPSGTEAGLYNTLIGLNYYEPVTDTIRIVFTEPIDPSDISISNLNFFIVTNPVDATTARTEIHLSGFEPTDKANMSLLGTGADNSINGKNYATVKNMIWGLLIPTSFNYAAEFKDITAVYPMFAKWCTSGGVDNPYWYDYPTDKPDYVYRK